MQLPGKVTLKSNNHKSVYDAIIVGAGPAGLSAALLLGRCRRRTLLCDSGRPRNAKSPVMHGFLTRDGIAPGELLRIAREQLAAYECVDIREAEVKTVRASGQCFAVRLGDGSSHSARKILLASGVVDVLPSVEGIAALYGRSVFHCPYCDGWEMRDLPLAVYGRGAGGLGLARTLLGWSSDVVLCTDGPSRWPRSLRDNLRRYGIPVRSERIARVEGEAGALTQIVFANGSILPRRALFFHTGQGQRSNLASRLGCKMTAKGSVDHDKHSCTSVPGVYVAGDASRDVQLAIVAAAEGTSAAFAINKELLDEDLDKKTARRAGSGTLAQNGK